MRVSDFNSTFTINAEAQKLGISVSTLRLYDKEGLICPIRGVTHRRLYSTNDLKIVQTLQRLIHDQGLHFAGIRRLMALLPCWKIRRVDRVLCRNCTVPSITDYPCWSSGKSLWRKSNTNCQSCPVYEMACRIGDLSIREFMRV